jgi:hypothetical protein
MGLGRRLWRLLFDDTRFEQHVATPPLQGYGGALIGPKGTIEERVLDEQMRGHDEPHNEPDDTNA